MHTKCPYCGHELGQLRQMVVVDVRERGGTAHVSCDSDECNMNIIIVGSFGGVSIHKDRAYGTYKAKW